MDDAERDAPEREERTARIKMMAAQTKQAEAEARVADARLDQIRASVDQLHATVERYRDTRDQGERMYEPQKRRDRVQPWVLGTGGAVTAIIVAALS